ncbi:MULTISPECIES: DUF6644 family protein [Burkholderia cepacia complex]|uniref:DUF6644 family protein n=1 Tax=Burkholderia cepacia complex TaxID=87882 RepID=UPI0022EB876B|nr:MULTISPECIES: DUF6644 family protein [Burkholderia cepacia complex]MDA3672165.1 hypothetical protein [Burkholderia cenocepacia]MDA3681480.1 hypothetical protein [Burkholderia cenocepacia]MDA3689093.1 hypothetical protein [Burkholderia cenocepacia]MDA3696474.1 hypothetical protein [Burkholderia cenocepacia]MDA3703875.1 hypothetical protein [Burkholderia cenocepacia]
MFTQNFIPWLYQTSLSTAIRDLSWVVPTVQSVHILAIAAIFGSAVVSDLRLAGVLATDEPVRTVVRRYSPWMWRALAVLLTTGLVMVIGEPERVLKNPMFWLKMVLIVGVCTLTWLLRRPLLGCAEIDEGHAPGNRLAGPAAWLSLVSWCCVIVCGRWIAYTI